MIYSDCAEANVMSSSSLLTGLSGCCIRSTIGSDSNCSSSSSESSSSRA